MEKNCIFTAATLIALWSAGLSAGLAYVKESNETVKTYPFSDSNPAKDGC